MKEALTEIFSEYGTIIDIVAKTNLRAKGQAFIVFDDTEAAQRAIQEVQGFELFDKPMTLDYAKTKSDATVLQNGSTEDFEAHRRRRLAEKGESSRLQPASSEQQFLLTRIERRQANEAVETQKRAKRAADVAPEPANRSIKSTRGAGLKSSNPSAGAVVPEEYLPPNRILFLQNLPEDYDVEGLSSIFSAFEGFKEVRLVPGRKGIAFVEYEAEAGAISAKERTAGMPMGNEGKLMKVVYQRK